MKIGLLDDIRGKHKTFVNLFACIHVVHIYIIKPFQRKRNCWSGASFRLLSPRFGQPLTVLSVLSAFCSRQVCDLLFRKLQKCRAVGVSDMLPEQTPPASQGAGSRFDKIFCALVLIVSLGICTNP